MEVDLLEQIEGSDCPQPSAEDVHRVLANERRRLALAVLGHRSPPIDVRTLAEEMLELDRSGEHVPEDEVRQVALELYHRHLPMMAEVGVIDVDESGKRVDTARVGSAES